MKYALIWDDKAAEVVNVKKVFTDIATYPKKEIKQLLKEQLFFIEVYDRVDDLTSKGFITKLGGSSEFDDALYCGVKASANVLKKILGGQSVAEILSSDDKTTTVNP